MNTISINLPEAALLSLGKTSKDLGREILVAAVVKWFELGTISQGKAAEILEIARGIFRRFSGLPRFGMAIYERRIRRGTPVSTKTLVTDSSPIIVLLKSDLESILPELYEEIIVPEPVWAEVLAGKTNDVDKQKLSRLSSGQSECRLKFQTKRSNAIISEKVNRRLKYRFDNFGIESFA